MSLPNAGWYPDTFDAHLIRWWSGESWTSHVQPVPAPEPVAEAPVASEPTRAQHVLLPVQELVGASLGTGDAPTSGTRRSRAGTLRSPVSAPDVELPSEDGPRIFRSGFIPAASAAVPAAAPAVPTGASEPAAPTAAAEPAAEEPAAPAAEVPPSWTNGLPPVSTDVSDAALEALYRKRAEQIASQRASGPDAVDDSAVGSAFAPVRITPVQRQSVMLSMQSTVVEPAAAPAVAAQDGLATLPSASTGRQSYVAASAPVLDFDALLHTEPRPSTGFVADSHLTSAVESLAQPEEPGEPELTGRPHGRRRLVAVSLVLAIVVLGGCGAYLAPQVAERVWGATPTSSSADEPHSMP
jgi:hypothetical protein